VKTDYKKTGEKHGIYNVVIPDMTKYRVANSSDKQHGDLFNIGKWLRQKNKYILASCPNEHCFSQWHLYYLVKKVRI